MSGCAPKSPPAGAAAVQPAVNENAKRMEGVEYSLYAPPVGLMQTLSDSCGLTNPNVKGAVRVKNIVPVVLSSRSMTRAFTG